MYRLFPFLLRYERGKRIVIMPGDVKLRASYLLTATVKKSVIRARDVIDSKNNT